MNELNVAQLHALLHYEPSTGVFTWKTRAGANGKIPAGSVAGCSTEDYGYHQIRINKKLYQAHRLAWFYVHGVWPSRHIDHKNGVTSDNSLDNLREVTPTQNGQNQRRAHSRSTSGLLGAAWDKGRGLWRAAIQTDGHGKYLGHFTTPELAHAAYIKAKRELHTGCTI